MPFVVGTKYGVGSLLVVSMCIESSVLMCTDDEIGKAHFIYMSIYSFDFSLTWNLIPTYYGSCPIILDGTIFDRRLQV